MCKARKTLRQLGFHASTECPSRNSGGYPGCSACSDALDAHDCVPREVAEQAQLALDLFVRFNRGNERDIKYEDVVKAAIAAHDALERELGGANPMNPNA